MNDVRERWQQAARAWNPQSTWIQVETIDAHTAGEPLRIIVAGWPQIEGRTILQRRQFARENHEDFRRLLMWEPRGHHDMYGCLIVEPESSDADFGVLFLHNEGYSSMCGHGIIAVTKAAVEMGLVQQAEPQTQVTIDSPAGKIRAVANIENNRVCHVAFVNVPSYVVVLDQRVAVARFGEINFDLAFGGAYYAYVDASQINLGLSPSNTNEIVAAGRAIKQAVANSHPIEHPIHDDLSFLYGTIFVGPADNPDHHSRNVCVFADGEVDRSPTGTGVSGRAAIEFQRQKLSVGQSITIESILGTVFTVEVAETTMLESYDAIVPRVGGQAFFTGQHRFIIDPDDPLKKSFLL